MRLWDFIDKYCAFLLIKISIQYAPGNTSDYVLFWMTHFIMHQWQGFGLFTVTLCPKVSATVLPWSNITGLEACKLWTWAPLSIKPDMLRAKFIFVGWGLKNITKGNWNPPYVRMKAKQFVAYVFPTEKTRIEEDQIINHLLLHVQR